MSIQRKFTRDDILMTSPPFFSLEYFSSFDLICAKWSHRQISIFLHNMKGPDSIEDDLNEIVADINDTNQKLSDIELLKISVTN